jgi:hypothetical protein
MIITAATLILVIGILGYSNSLFNNETQNAEFSQAQTTFLSLADDIDSVATRQGASAYVLLNSRSGGPSWSPSIDNLVVTVNINGTSGQPNWVYTVISGNVNSLLYRAGSGVGTVNSTLRGNNTYSILNNVYPMGLVNVTQHNGAYVSLDYDRIGIVDLGYLNVSTGVDPSLPHTNHTAWDYIHLIQISFVNLTFGGVQGGGKYISATNTFLNVTYYRLNFTGSISGISYGLQVNITHSSSALLSGNYTYIQICPPYALDADTYPPGGAAVNMSVATVVEVIQPVINVTFLG